MTNDKFILIGMDDSRSKDIAEILGNKTCKKILDYLADTKEASEKDISDALSIPINTVEYNLNKLIKAGLAEKTKNFFWSRKGRKIEMYKLAKKHIVISPKSTKVDMQKLKSVVPVILISALVIASLVGLLMYFEKGNNLPNIPGKNIIQSDEAKNFNSIEEMTEFLKKRNQDESSNYFFGGVRNTMMGGDVAMEAALPPTAMAKDSSSEGSGGSNSASSYSNTNIQVEGVDEADIVKNDEKYIYTLSGNKVVIVNAYPAENMNIVSKIENLSSPRNIFVNGDKLVIFLDGYSSTPVYGKMGMMAAESSVACYGRGCGGYSEPRTDILIYDINDRSKPILEKNISIEGSYQDTRMVGDYVYVISSKYINQDNPRPPIYMRNGVLTDVPMKDIYYFEDHSSSYIFTIISAINLKEDSMNTKVYMIGSTGTTYVSENNIFITYQKSWDQEEYVKSYSEDVILKILTGEEKSKVNDILESDIESYRKMDRINNIITDYSSSLEGEEKSEFDKRFYDLYNNFESEFYKRSVKTAINKISIDKLNINYLGSGEVPGTVLNQFSMDEYNNYFRIATTTGNNWNSLSGNNLYVLDEDLKVIGKIEDLAKGERIYSARFMGKRAYMVTFKTVDPLFVIDLSNEKDPKVLGYLKIPGYSDYLHPYDENHVIGIGKDVNESIDADKVHSDNAVYYTAILGLKVSLFDVSDVENPIEKSKIVIGERGTESPATYDHKALLFDKEKGILVLPVTLTQLRKQSGSYNNPEYEYPEQIWQGAYILNIDDEDISIRGRITHHEENYEKLKPAKEEAIGAIRIDSQKNIWTKFNIIDQGRGYTLGQWKTDSESYKDIIYNDYDIDSFPGGVNYYPFQDYSKQIQRSLYMDDVLYTISLSNIKANNLNDLEEIKKLELDYKNNYNYPVLYAE